MKSWKISAGVLAIAVAAALIGVPLVPAPTLAQEAGKKSDPAQFARGAKGWAENCSHCHNLRDPKEYSDKNWDVILSQMRVRANLPGQLVRDIEVFLKASN